MIRSRTYRLLGLVAVLVFLPGCESLRAARRHSLQDKIIKQHTLSGPVAAELRPAGHAQELWIIAKGEPPHPTRAAELPNVPYLRRIEENGGEGDHLPLARTDLRASVTGPVVIVAIRQQYRNPFSRSIDVEYVFPLPANAAVSDFLMTIGTRQIRGIIRERGEAQRLYAEVSRAGHVAALLTESGPNTFTQALANIEPGKEIDIQTTYFNTLGYRDGEYELVLPPTSESSAQPDRSELVVDLDAGMEIESIRSPSHAIVVQRSGSDRAHIELQGNDRLASRSAVLRYKTVGDGMKSAFLAHHDHRGGFFILVLQPPADLRQALTGVEVDWGTLDPRDVHPQPIPDLSSGNPVVLSGRFHNPAPTTIHVIGQVGTVGRSHDLTVSSEDLVEHHPALVSLWARTHLAALERESNGELRTGRRQEIADVAFEYGLISPDTAIFAVDAGNAEKSSTPTR